MLTLSGLNLPSGNYLPWPPPYAPQGRRTKAKLHLVEDVRAASQQAITFVQNRQYSQWLESSSLAVDLVVRLVTVETFWSLDDGNLGVEEAVKRVEKYEEKWRKKVRFSTYARAFLAYHGVSPALPAPQNAPPSSPAVPEVPKRPNASSPRASERPQMAQVPATPPPHISSELKEIQARTAKALDSPPLEKPEASPGMSRDPLEAGTPAFREDVSSSLLPREKCYCTASPCGSVLLERVNSSIRRGNGSEQARNQPEQLSSGGLAPGPLPGGRHGPTVSPHPGEASDQQRPPRRRKRRHKRPLNGPEQPSSGGVPGSAPPGAMQAPAAPQCASKISELSYPPSGRKIHPDRPLNAPELLSSDGVPAGAPSGAMQAPAAPTGASEASDQQRPSRRHKIRSKRGLNGPKQIAPHRARSNSPPGGEPCYSAPMRNAEPSDRQRPSNRAKVRSDRAQDFPKQSSIGGSPPRPPPGPDTAGTLYLCVITSSGVPQNSSIGVLGAPCACLGPVTSQAKQAGACPLGTVHYYVPFNQYCSVSVRDHCGPSRTTPGLNGDMKHGSHCFQHCPVASPDRPVPVTSPMALQPVPQSMTPSSNLRTYAQVAAAAASSD